MVELFYQIKPRLDGRLGLNEILEFNPEKYLPTTVSFLLKILKLNGVLQEGISVALKDAASSELEEEESRNQFFSHFALDPGGLAQVQRKSRLAVVGSPSLVPMVVDQLEKSGFQEPTVVNVDGREKDSFARESLKERFGESDLVIACQDNEGYPFYHFVNSVSLESGARWMHASLYGARAVLGPTIIPLQTACYSCYETRRVSNSDDWEGHSVYRETFQDTSHPTEGHLYSLSSGLASQVSLEALRIVTGFAPPKTLGRFYEFSATSPVPEGHDVLRLPRCPNCNPTGPKREIWDSLATL